MAEQWIEKEVIHKDRKTKEKHKAVVRYRVDTDFVPTSSAQVCQEFMENYCVKHGKIDWLINNVSQTYVDKKGKERPYPFTQTRADFMEEFFSDKRKTRESWADKLKRKYGKAE